MRRQIVSRHMATRSPHVRHHPRALQERASPAQARRSSHATWASLDTHGQLSTERSPANECRPVWRHRTAGKPRLLFITAVDVGAMPIELAGFKRANWSIGLLRTSMCSRRVFGCGLFTGNLSGEPLSYLRSVRGGLTPDHVVSSVVSWRPALVVGDKDVTYSLMQQAARSIANNRTYATALRVLKCSLPKREYWSASVVKSKLISLGRSLGALTPWTVRANSITLRQTQNWIEKLPLVVKTDRDGAGKGVSICENASCVLEVVQRNEQVGHPESAVQQYIRGVVCTFVGVSLHGRTLGGFSVVKQATAGKTGASMLMRTVNNDDAAQVLQDILLRTGHTGVASADFLVDRQGMSYLIDVNLRLSNFIGIHPDVIGISPGLLDRLRIAGLHGVNYSEFKYSPLSRSVTVAKYTPHWWAHRIFPYILSCSHIFVDIPWEFPVFRQVEYLGFDAQNCTMWHRNSSHIKVRNGVGCFTPRPEGLLTPHTMHMICVPQRDNATGCALGSPLPNFPKLVWCAS